MNSSFNNTSFGKVPRNEFFSIVLGILTIPIVIFGLSGALLFLYILKKDTKQRTSVKASFVNLCLSSLVFCIFSGPFQALTYITNTQNFLASPDHDGLCQLNAFLNISCVYIVVLCHASIAANRFLVIFFHDRPGILNSRLLFALLLIIPWAVPVAIYIFPFFHLGGSYGFLAAQPMYKCTFVKREKSYLFLSRTLTTGLALAIIFSAYFAIWLKVITIRSQGWRLFNRSNTIEDGGVVPRPGPRYLRQMRRDVRVARNTFIACLALVICFLPSTVYVFSVKSTANSIGMTLIFLQWLGKFIFSLVLYEYCERRKSFHF
jgi:hypothetical protein